MKTRLEKKEIFIPLAGGTDTSGDPRAPKSPTLVTENVDFNIDGVARKRDALATFVGNTATDAPTAFTNDRYMAKSQDGSIVFFGKDLYEYSSNGAVSNAYAESRGYGRMVDVERVFIASSPVDFDSVGSAGSDSVNCNSNSGVQRVCIVGGLGSVAMLAASMSRVASSSTRFDAVMSSSTNGVWLISEDVS